MHTDIKAVIQTLQSLAAQNYEASVKASNAYGQKIAQVRASSFMHAANVVREACGEFSQDFSHSASSHGSCPGGSVSQG